MNSLIQVTTTTNTLESAKQISDHLINSKLAACCQIIGPIQSIYNWKDTLETSSEYQCVIKTKKELEIELYKVLKSIHSYEIPEIISQVITTSDDYLEWVLKSTK